MRYLKSGFKFGMFLQLAVGPVCLFIFNVATNFGLAAALSGVLAVALVDGLEIILAIAGINSLMSKYKFAKEIIKYFGITVLVVFGLNNMLSAFSNVQCFISPDSASEVFLFTFILTLSNPLTVIFWTGIFSAKISQENMRQNDLYKFGFGCILATLCFLASVAFAGSLSQDFLPAMLLKLLNFLVGLFMFAFALKIILALKNSARTAKRTDNE